MIETAKDGFESPLIEAAIGLGVGEWAIAVGMIRANFPAKLALIGSGDRHLTVR
jgi:hypothetical protein